MRKTGLRGEEVDLELTEFQIQELYRCDKDRDYFLSEYVTIIHPDHDERIPFIMRDFQKELCELIDENSNVMSMVARQSGKSIIIAGYVLNYVIFNSNKYVVIVSNTGTSAKKLLAKIKKMYHELPMFLQHGVVEWNKTSIELENGCKISVEATTEDAGTGDTVNLFICDEFAKVPKNIAEPFMNSVLPTLSAGKSQKLVIITTPKGMNFFYKLWKKQDTLDEPEYVRYKKDWRANPDRDEAWAEKERKKVPDFAQEYECLSYDSIVTVKEEYTNYVRNVKIGDLFNLLSFNSFLVKTPNGFEKFSGIDKKLKNKYIELTFDDGRKLKTSYSHLLIDENNEEVEVCKLNVGDTIKGEKRNYTICKMDRVKDTEIELYDLINVGENNVFYVNGVLSHNCSFLGSAGSLVSSVALARYEYCDPIEEHEYSYIDNLRIYELPNKNEKYVLTCDCASGLLDKNGNIADSSVCHVLKILPESIIQVARFSSASVDEVEFSEIIAELGFWYNTAPILVEANNMGISVLDNLQFVEDYPEVIDINNKDKYIGGLTVSSKTNAIGNRIMRKLINKNYIILKDFDTIGQFSNYCKVGSTYKGIDGEHDDDCTALRNFCYLINTEEWLELDDLFKSYKDILKEEMIKKNIKIKKKNDKDESFFFLIK